MSTPPLPRSLFRVIGSYHPHLTCRGCQLTAINAAATARVIGAMRGAYGDGTHQAAVIRVHHPEGYRSGLVRDTY